MNAPNEAGAPSVSASVGGTVPPTPPSASTEITQPWATANASTLSAVPVAARVETTWQPESTSTVTPSAPTVPVRACPSTNTVLEPYAGSVTRELVLAGMATARSSLPPSAVANAAPTGPRTVGVTPSAGVSPPGCGRTAKRL